MHGAACHRHLMVHFLEEGLQGLQATASFHCCYCPACQLMMCSLLCHEWAGRGWQGAAVCSACSAGSRALLLTL
jgi:hypothetical protein